MHSLLVKWNRRSLVYVIIHQWHWLLKCHCWVCPVASLMWNSPEEPIQHQLWHAFLAQSCLDCHMGSSFCGHIAKAWQLPIEIGMYYKQQQPGEHHSHQMNGCQTLWQSSGNSQLPYGSNETWNTMELMGPSLLNTTKRKQQQWQKTCSKHLLVKYHPQTALFECISWISW
jgi:hypothetical protein